MIQVAPEMRILVAIEAVDLCKRIDGLAQLCRQKLDTDPFSGHLLIFRGRRVTAIKVLACDGQGFWLAQKRLAKEIFWWPTGKEPTRVLQAHQAQLLLAAGNPEILAAPMWRLPERPNPGLAYLLGGMQAMLKGAQNHKAKRG